VSLTGTQAGDYSLTIQSPASATITLPSLTIEASPPNIILSWPTAASYFVLNQTASLNWPITWTQITSGITVSGVNNTITITTSGNEYYTLIAP
jgi:hypothetical protein